MPADENKGKTERRRVRSSSHAHDIDMDPTTADALSKQEKLSRELLEIQQKAFQACLQTFVETVNKRVDAVIFEHRNTISDLKASLEYTQADVSKLKINHQEADKDAKKNQKKVEEVGADLQSISSQADNLENQLRRNNLRIDGIPETFNETWQQTENLVRNQLTTALGLTAKTASKIEIERTHRIHTSMFNPDISSITLF